MSNGLFEHNTVVLFMPFYVLSALVTEKNEIQVSENIFYYSFDVTIFRFSDNIRFEVIFHNLKDH